MNRILSINNTPEEREYYEKLLKLQEDFLEYNMRRLLLTFSKTSDFMGRGERWITLLSTITGDLITTKLTREEMKEISKAPICDFLCFWGIEDATIFRDLFKGALIRCQKEEN